MTSSNGYRAPSSGKRIYLVSCVKEKSPRPTVARDLYRSPWFEKARRYVVRQNQPWYILSAKYGLLKPDQIVAPYEQTLNTMGVTDRRRWASLVLEELRTVVAPGDEVAFLAGLRYRENLQAPLENWGISVSVPMEGLRIGAQLHWLDTRA